MTDTQQYTVIACAACNMPFAVTVDFEKKRRVDHVAFYCPVGHPQSFRGQSEEERLRALAEDRACRIAELQDELNRCERLRQRKKWK